jgi:hypothetical protein
MFGNIISGNCSTLLRRAIPTWWATRKAGRRDHRQILSRELADKLGHIVTAQCVPLNQWKDRLAKVPNDKPVIPVCHAAMRSGQATVMPDAGFREWPIYMVVCFCGSRWGRQQCIVINGIKAANNRLVPARNYVQSSPRIRIMSWAVCSRPPRQTRRVLRGPPASRPHCRPAARRAVTRRARRGHRCGRHLHRRGLSYLAWPIDKWPRFP